MTPGWALFLSIVAAVTLAGSAEPIHRFFRRRGDDFGATFYPMVAAGFATICAAVALMLVLYQLVRTP